MSTLKEDFQSKEFIEFVNRSLSNVLKMKIYNDTARFDTFGMTAFFTNVYRFVHAIKSLIGGDTLDRHKVCAGIVIAFLYYKPIIYVGEKRDEDYYCPNEAFVIDIMEHFMCDDIVEDIERYVNVGNFEIQKQVLESYGFKWSNPTRDRLPLKTCMRISLKKYSDFLDVLKNASLDEIEIVKGTSLLISRIMFECEKYNLEKLLNFLDIDVKEFTRFLAVYRHQKVV